MALLDEAKAIGTRKPQRCEVQHAMDANPKLADEIVELITSPRSVVPHSVVERVLRSHGMHVGQYTIGRHRDGRCRWCTDAGRTYS
jgi:hypothetical protein